MNDGSGDGCFKTEVGTNSAKVSNVSMDNWTCRYLARESQVVIENKTLMTNRMAGGVDFLLFKINKTLTYSMDDTAVDAEFLMFLIYI